MCAAASPRSNGGTSKCSTDGFRCNSANVGRNGWSRCTSSVRYVMITSSGSERRFGIRNDNRSRVDRSAQWMSSITKTVDPDRASRANSASTDWNSWTRLVGSGSARCDRRFQTAEPCREERRVTWVGLHGTKNLDDRSERHPVLAEGEARTDER